MKKIIAIVFSIFIVLPAISQVNFGLKLGLNTTSVTMDDLNTITSAGTMYTVEKLKGANFGIHGGLFVRLKISKLYIQPELLLSTRTNEYTVTNITNLTHPLDSTVIQKFTKLDIPVMIGFKLGPLRLNAGPSASLLLNSPADLIKDPKFKTIYSNLTFGYQAGVGIDLLNKLTIDLRYEGSLQKYQNKIENAVGVPVTLDDRPNAFLVSVGMFF